MAEAWGMDSVASTVAVPADGMVMEAAWSSEVEMAAACMDLAAASL